MMGFMRKSKKKNESGSPISPARRHRLLHEELDDFLERQGPGQKSETQGESSSSLETDSIPATITSGASSKPKKKMMGFTRKPRKKASDSLRQKQASSIRKKNKSGTPISAALRRRLIEEDLDDFVRKEIKQWRLEKKEKEWQGLGQKSNTPGQSSSSLETDSIPATITSGTYENSVVQSKNKPKSPEQQANMESSKPKKVQDLFDFYE